MNSFESTLKFSKSFETLRDEGYRADAQALEFARNFAQSRTAAAERDPGSGREDEDEPFNSWTALKKIKGYIIEFLAPIAIQEYAPASLGASAAPVQAANAEYLPEIGGYLRFELRDVPGTDLLELKCWLEDHEGAPPFEDYSIRGVLEPAAGIPGAELREFELRNPAGEPITLEINPKLHRCAIFDLCESGRPLIENIQFSLRA